ncbi:MAG: TolC family protein [bacterium]
MMVFLLFLQIDSLSLNEAIDMALDQSPAYYEAKITFEKSRILYYQTLASLLPTISASGTYTNSKYQGVENSGYSGNIQLNQPLFDLDILSSVFIGGRQQRGSSIQYDAQIAGLILNLKTAYFNLINARELLKSSEIAIERARENLELIEAKYELGAASRLEMLQGEVFHLSALQDRARARTLEISAHEELKSILGTHEEIHVIDTLTTPDSTEFLTLDSMFVILASVNYNIQIAQELRKAAKLDLVSSYLRFLPKISFFYGYSYNSDSLVFDFQHIEDNATRNYGITMSLPIFEIKSLIFNHLNAKKELELREYEQRRIILENEKNLRTTYFALQESYERVHFARKSFDAATEASIIAREQYALGIISFLDFLSAEKDLYEAKVSFKSALSDIYIQRANLSYLLGQSFNGE